MRGQEGVQHSEGKINREGGKRRIATPLFAFNRSVGQVPKKKTGFFMTDHVGVSGGHALGDEEGVFGGGTHCWKTCLVFHDVVSKVM